MSKVRDAYRPVLRDDGSVDVSGLDFSGIDQYLRCGQQFRFRWVEGKKSPPNVALAEGVSHHSAVEEDNKRKMSTGKNMNPDALTGAFVNHLRSTVKTYAGECENLRVPLDWGGEDENKLVKRARVFHVEYYNKFSPGIDPEGAEDQFTADVEARGQKFKLFGQIDLVQKSKITDYKVTGRAKSQRDVEESLQLSIYSWAKKKKKVSIINFVKAASPYVQEIVAPRAPQDWMWALEVSASVVGAVRRGIFPLARPDPQTWWCSGRFCGYWSMCRGKYEKR